MRPLVLLVLAEFLVLVLLAVLAFARGPAAAAVGPQRAVEALGGRAPAPAAGELPSATGVDAARSPANERQPAAPATETFRPDDPIGIVVSGSVRSTDGKPVADTYVGFQRDGGYRGGNTSASGAYAVAGLAPGDWQVDCRADGFARYQTNCTFDDRAFQQVDIELSPSYVVKVRIQTPAGEFLPDLLTKQNMWAEPGVVATTEPLAGSLPITENAAVLSFGVGEWHPVFGISSRSNPSDKQLRDQGYAGELRLDQAPPVFAALLLRHVLLQTQSIEPGQHELTFTIEAKDVTAAFGTVKLRLLDAAGQPLAKVAVRLETAQGGGSQAVTDAEGRAEIAQAMPGLGCLEFMAKDMESPWRYVRVPAGGTVDLGDLVVSPVIKITGRVVDADGKPVTDANITWTELDCRSWPQPLVDRRSASVDAEGRFELWDSGRHRYVVHARTRAGAFGHATVDASGGPPAEMKLVLLATTRVAFRIGCPPTVGYMVTVLDQARSPVSVHWFGSAYRATGVNLPPGSYTVEIHDAADSLVRSFPLAVGNEPLTIDVP